MLEYVFFGALTLADIGDHGHLVGECVHVLVLGMNVFVMVLFVHH